MSLSVASRRRELAIRSALGAQRGDISNLILNEAGRLIAGGIVSAFVLARALRSFLFDVEPTDPWMLVGASVTVRRNRSSGVLDADAPRSSSRCARSFES